MKKLLINGLDEQTFLRKYLHDNEGVSEIGLDWKDLVELYEDYCRNIPYFEMFANSVHQELRKVTGAYMIKYRVKDAEHVIDKVIRKKKEKNISITKDNYIDIFDDIIGCRILHLFKDEWKTIHEYLKSQFIFNEEPIAYFRKGDSEDFLEQCRKLDIEPKEHKAGYRSIHYVIKMPIMGVNLTCEVQTRTIIEDAWSEIDHLVRYPNNTSDELINRYLLLFNAFAGAADDMGSYLCYLKASLLEESCRHQKKVEQLNTIVLELKNEIANLKNINAAQKKKIDGLVANLDTKSNGLMQTSNDNSYFNFNFSVRPYDKKCVIDHQKRFAVFAHSNTSHNTAFKEVQDALKLFAGNVSKIQNNPYTKYLEINSQKSKK